MATHLMGLFIRVEVYGEMNFKQAVGFVDIKAVVVGEESGQTVATVVEAYRQSLAKLVGVAHNAVLCFKKQLALIDVQPDENVAGSAC